MPSADYVSYLAFVGANPQGMIARQTCNNLLCVDPDHIELFNPDAWNQSGVP